MPQETHDPSPVRNELAGDLARRGRALLDEGNETEALACLEQALGLEPENEEAAEPLAELLLKRGDPARAEPLLQLLLRRFRQRKRPAELRPIHLKLAECYERLERPGDAARWLRVALQVDSNDRAATNRLAALLDSQGEPEEALKLYQTILVQHADQLPKPERAELYWRIGRIKRAGGEGTKAVNMWEKALGLEPRHRPSLEALAELALEDGDAQKAIGFKLRIAVEAPEGDRFALLREIGDLRRAKLADPAGAAAAYGDALAVRPDDREARVALFEALREAKDWPRAIEACLTLAQTETDPRRISACHQFVAGTYRDQLQDADQAVAFFDRALDADPDNLGALQALEQILVPRRDWRGLEGVYRRMLDRLPETGRQEIRETLLQALADLARDRLEDLPAAAEWLARAVELNPTHGARRLALAELYTRIPGRWADAAAQHQWLLRADPKRVDSYRALRRLYQQAGRPDEAWCVCGALTFLERAQPNEKEYYERHRPRSAPVLRGGVSADSWERDLRHPQENPAVGRVLASLTPGLRKLLGRNSKAFGLRKQDAQDPGTSQVAVARALRDSSRGLDVPYPELYVIADHPGGLSLALTEPPATVAGKDVVSGFTPVELRFVAATHLCAYRPEHYAAYLLHLVAEESKLPLLDVLGAYFGAARRLADPAAGASPDATAAARRLEPHVGPVDRDRIRASVRRLAEVPEADLAGWLAGTDLTRDRAGLVLCGDLGVAVAAIPRVPPLVPEVTAHRRVDELIAFSVSDACFSLRRELGIAFSDGSSIPPPPPAEGEDVPVFVDGEA